MAAETRSYRFVITFEVEPDHPAYDDPEWAVRSPSSANNESPRCGAPGPAVRSPVLSSHFSRSEAMDITDVEILHDHVVRLRFADGVEKTVDLI